MYVLNFSFVLRKKSWHSAKDGEPQVFEAITKCLRQVEESNTIDEELKKKVSGALNRLELTWWAIWILLIGLFFIEIAQFAAKSFKKRFKSYVTFQNFVEIGLMLTTIAFLLLSGKSITIGGNLGGWILFIAWINFTTYLCQISRFGRAIYSSIYVTKKIANSLVIFIPSLVGFTAGFHLFMNGNDNFRDFGRAYLKVLVMMLGEYDYEDNFSYTKGLEVGGRNFSLQVSIHNIK